MRLFQVFVNGELKLTIPAAVRRDGTLWGGDNPLLNGFLLQERGISNAEAAAQVRKKKLTPEVLSCVMTVGDNPGGRLVVDKSAAETAQKIAEEAAMSPRDRDILEARKAIAIAESRRDRCDRSQDDVEFHQLDNAVARLETDFANRYPDEIKKDRAHSLRSLAARERALASGAMLYDADGSLSLTHQQKRRDEGLAKAADLDQQAAMLEAEIDHEN